MNRLFGAAVALALSATAASAVCTKKSLNGSWVIGAAGGSIGVLGSATSGTFTFVSPVSTFTLNIASFNSKTCKGSGSGSIDSVPITFKINSERIPGSAQKPNHLLAQVTVSGSTYTYMMQRQ